MYTKCHQWNKSVTEDHNDIMLILVIVIISGGQQRLALFNSNGFYTCTLWMEKEKVNIIRRSGSWKLPYEA